MLSRKMDASFCDMSDDLHVITHIAESHAALACQIAGTVSSSR
jgi:hypothetical protein